MNTNLVAHVAGLSDTDLLAQLRVLAQNERDATVALIVHLAEVDEWRLYLSEGYSSLFAYCTDVLRLSEHATYNRIEVARIVRRCPLVLRDLEEGALNLTTARLLGPHLTADNYQHVLTGARYKCRREVEELAAALRPQPPMPDAVRRLPGQIQKTVEASLSFAPVQVGMPGVQHSVDPPRPELHAVSPTDRVAVVTPLAPERYKVTFTASAELNAKLRKAQALLRHQIPNGDLGQIFDRALSSLLRDLEKQKAATTDRPRGPAGGDTSSNSRHVPAAVRREVWRRDGGRCAFRSRSGRHCGEESFLEFHHVVPYATGGRATTDNIELRCRAHNEHESEQFFAGRNLRGVSGEEHSQLVPKRVSGQLPAN